MISSVIFWVCAWPLKRAGERAVAVNAELGARMWDGVAGVHGRSKRIPCKA